MTGRRRQTDRERRAGGTDDSFLLVTLAQAVLCAGMIATAFFLSNATGATGLREAYGALLSQETQAQEVWAALDGVFDSEPVEQARAVVRTVLERIADRQENTAGQGGAYPVATPFVGNLSAPEGTTLETVTLSAPMAQPIAARLTSAFGYREHPITGKTDFHTGLDLAAPKGTPIGAAYPGVVGAVGQSNIYGKFVLLDHGGFQTRYCHCDTILVTIGMRLRQGERLATVGETGLATGPHLHFELYVNGQAADPMAGAQNWHLE